MCCSHACAECLYTTSPLFFVTQDVGDYIHAKQLEAQDNTDDSLTLIITLLWVCIPIAIVVAIGTIFSVRYVWQLLSTYCSVIEWSLRMVVKDHDAKAILLQSMKARCAGIHPCRSWHFCRSSLHQ